MNPNFYVAYDKKSTLPIACGSAKEVAAALDCTVHTLYTYIADRTRPRKYEVYKFAPEPVRRWGGTEAEHG